MSGTRTPARFCPVAWALLPHHALLITLEALRAYAAENSGALPESLDKLTPLQSKCIPYCQVHNVPILRMLDIMTRKCGNGETVSLEQIFLRDETLCWQFDRRSY